MQRLMLAYKLFGIVNRLGLRLHWWADRRRLLIAGRVARQRKGAG